ncbi:ankyrin repeat-containing domain protein [Mycena pura]|uniref:Ankyrin repeat-containing domain protein n=1 Tax=Mycena pura TaxID=153505 RepID=A0AAD6US73_9AGAR|nr:ankyrin repeat-containing domain protein [Mycena pura]
MNSSTVITKLTDDQQICKELGDPVAVAFFFFDFTNKEAHFVEVALRRIVLQLSAQSPHPYRALKKQYMLMRGQTLPTFNELKNVLQELLSELGRTYIILDALDECRDTEVDQLLDLVSFLQGCTNNSLHLFITSQPRSHLSDLPCGDSLHIYLWRDRSQDDIQFFVRKELHKNRKLKRWVPHADEIAMQIVDKSNGIFRVAACLLLALSRSQWPKGLDETLRQFPNHLFGVYDRFLKAIIPEHFIYVVGVLRWLLFSRQRLTLRQLADAIAFDFSDPTHYIYVPNNDINENVTAILEWLQGLVALTVVFGGDSSGQLHIALAHASVKDYLLSPHFTQTFCFDLNLGPSHTFIAQSCLGYLIHFADHPLNTTTFPKYHLAFYAAKNWYHHFLLCPDRTSLFPDILRLLENGSSQCLALNNLRLCGPQSALSGKLRCLPLAPPSLYMYSQEGYEVIVRLLLMHGANINEQTPEFGHALQTASGGGHIDVVRLLLDMGADVNAHGGRCFLCFLRAGSDSLEDPELLWEHSKDTNAECAKYGNALSAASGGGYTDVARLLLRNGAAVNAHGGLVCECLSAFNMPASRYPTALQAAAGGGHTEVVRLLIENGADVDDAEGGVLGGALQAASSEGTTEIVEVLLEHGAEVNSQRGYYGNALQAASSEGSTKNIQLLLDHGAAINAQGGFFGNALQGACYHGYTQAARLLISNGAEVNAKGGRYGCALQAAVSTYKPYTAEMARLLLENSADVNMQGGKFGNALQAAAKGGESEIVRLLINAGANVNAEGGKYGTALQAACSGGVKEIVQLLIDSGADVNIQGGKFGSALSAAISKGHKEIASLLLDKGAVPTSLVITVGIHRILRGWSC